jgi:hypothetical protein
MKSDNTGEADFSFGIREVRLHRQQQDALAIAKTPAKPVDNRGADPYNTSGNFDRRNNWARVYKR